MTNPLPALIPLAHDRPPSLLQDALAIVLVGVPLLLVEVVEWVARHSDITKGEQMNWRGFLPRLITSLIPYTTIRLSSYIDQPYLWWHALIDLPALAIIVAFGIYTHKRIEGYNKLLQQLQGQFVERGRHE